MTLNEYQRLARRTHILSDDSCSNYALGLAGEAGEVANLLKKALFHGHSLDPSALAKELGDCLWYIALLAEIHGIELDTVATLNIEKLRARYPDGFSTEASINRNEDTGP